MFQIDHKSTMLIYFLCAIIVGANCQTETEEGNGRVGYYTVTSDGTSTLTFNATSIQNGVILGFLVLVLGALILPLLGVNLFSFEDEFTSASTTDSTAYGQSYYNFAKRTGMDLMGPVLSAINKGRKKYGKKNEEEQ